MCLANIGKPTIRERFNRYGYKVVSISRNGSVICQYALQRLEFDEWAKPEDASDSYVEYSDEHVGLFSVFTTVDDAYLFANVPLSAMPVEGQAIVKVKLKGSKIAGYLEPYMPRCLLVKSVKPIEIIKT